MVYANTYIQERKRTQKQEKAIEKTGQLPRRTKLRSLYTREREERGEEERGRERGESDSVYPQSRHPSSEK